MTSVAETSPAASAAESSAAVMRVSSVDIASVLPQDPRHLEPLLLHGGRLGERFGGVRHGTGTSSRYTLVRPVACDVGGMPSAATSWTCATAVMI